MDSNQVMNNETSTPIKIPEYIKVDTQDDSSEIPVKLGFKDYEAKIFEIFCEMTRKLVIANENIISYDDAWKKVCKYGHDYLIREIYSEAGAQMNTREVIKKLYYAGYCEFDKGTLDYFVNFFLTNPEDKEDEKSDLDKDALIIKDMIIDLVEKMINNLKEAGRPFPTKERVVEILRKGNYNIKLENLNIEKFITNIEVEKFNEEFIQNIIKTSDLIQIRFRDETAILLTSKFLNDFCQEILFPKIMKHINENVSLDEKIRIIYKKKDRVIPPIESVFEDQMTEASFFWISTFYEIMTEENERLQDKIRNPKHLFMFQIASLLYYFTLNKREILLKEKEKKEQKEEDRREIEKKLLSDYAEPHSTEQILSFINNTTKLEDKYTIEDIVENIHKINDLAIKSDRLPNIIAVRIHDKTYYFHKYRFILMFFHQQNKESKRLKKHYIKKWAESPQLISRNLNKFEDDIRESLNDLFPILLQKVIPNIFARQDSQEELLPDEIFIKKENLVQSDLSDGKKNKEDYNLFLSSVFLKKNSLQIKPLYLLLDLNLTKIKKLAYKHRAKTVPFYMIIFSWLFGFLENIFGSSEIKEKIKSAISVARKKEDPIRELGLVVEFFKTETKLTPGQLDYLRKKVSEVKNEIREEQRQSKKSEKEEAEVRQHQREREVTKIKNYFLQEKTIEEKLGEYSALCFVKLGMAKKDSEDAVKSAIKSHFLRHRGKKVNNIDSIKSYAKAIVTHNTKVFSQIIDLEALRKYIEIVLLGVFLRQSVK